MRYKYFFNYVKNFIVQYWVILIPAVIYILHSWFFRNWILDDAGISFSYSRSLAFGHGLVSQPGMPPVEGYSNFLWVLLLVPFFWLRLFDPIITSKAITILLILSSFWIIYKVYVTLSKKYLIAVALSLLAVNTSFVLWTNSGLENALLTFLVILMFYLVNLIYSAGSMNNRLFLYLGIVAAGIALTRPDGIIYCGVFPVIWILQYFSRKSLGGKNLIYYFVPFVVIMSLFYLFRYEYYGSIFPNTYVVKGGPDLDSLYNLITMNDMMLNKLSRVFIGMFGIFGNLVMIIFSIAVIYLGSVKKLSRELFLSLLFTVFALSIYLIMPNDWWAENRFLTPFYAIFYISFVSIFWEFMKNLCFGKIIVITILASLLLGSIYIYIPRTKAQLKSPGVPFTTVAKNFGFRFNEYADLMDIQKGSLLASDLGGTLYYSKLKIYDEAGLCDKEVAKNLWNNPEKLRNYVFSQVKPTFIHTHGFWTIKWDFNGDQRLRQDYLTIYEEKDNQGRIIYGEYMRKDQVKDMGKFQKLTNRAKKDIKP